MEPDQRPRGVRVERRGVGYAAHGPRFYAWDEDPRALLEIACELAPGPPRAPQRPRPQRSRGALRLRIR